MVRQTLASLSIRCTQWEDTCGCEIPQDDSTHPSPGALRKGKTDEGVPEEFWQHSEVELPYTQVPATVRRRLFGTTDNQGRAIVFPKETESVSDVIIGFLRYFEECCQS